MMYDFLRTDLVLQHGDRLNLLAPNRRLYYSAETGQLQRYNQLCSFWLIIFVTPIVGTSTIALFLMNAAFHRFLFHKRVNFNPP